MKRTRINVADLQVETFETESFQMETSAVASCTSPRPCSVCCVEPTCTCDC